MLPVHQTVLLRMDEQLRTWQVRRDPRAVFLECYRLMTGNMLVGIENGRFHDPPWVRDLLVRFSEYYFEALQAFDACRDCPSVWQFTHQTTLDNRLHVMQALLLGINAHINFDLVFCLVEKLEAEWPCLSPKDRANRLGDHRMVNIIIGESIDQVQDDIIEREAPVWDLIDRLGGRMDERLLSILIRRWREKVWENAVAYMEEDQPAQRELIRQKVEKAALEKARLMAFF